MRNAWILLCMVASIVKSDKYTTYNAFNYNGAVGHETRTHLHQNEQQLIQLIEKTIHEDHEKGFEEKIRTYNEVQVLLLASIGDIKSEVEEVQITFDAAEPCMQQFCTEEIHKCGGPEDIFGDLDTSEKLIDSKIPNFLKNLKKQVAFAGFMESEQKLEKATEIFQSESNKVQQIFLHLHDLYSEERVSLVHSSKFEEEFLKLQAALLSDEDRQRLRENRKSALEILETLASSNLTGSYLPDILLRNRRSPNFISKLSCRKIVRLGWENYCTVNAAEHCNIVETNMKTEIQELRSKIETFAEDVLSFEEAIEHDLMDLIEDIKSRHCAMFSEVAWLQNLEFVSEQTPCLNVSTVKYLPEIFSVVDRSLLYYNVKASLIGLKQVGELSLQPVNVHLSWEMGQEVAKAIQRSLKEHTCRKSHGKLSQILNDVCPNSCNF